MYLASDLNLNNNKIQNFCVESLSGTPETLRKGKMWVDEESGTLKIAASSEETAAIFDEKTWGNYTSNSEISLKTLTILGKNEKPEDLIYSLSVIGNVNISGALNADSISGAIWNDYAEYRETVHQVKPGHCVCEKGDGKVYLSTKRLQKLPMIISDTFGFSIGKINETDVPIAVCGRVLVFTDKPLKTFKVGDWVCSGKNGKVSKMNFFEKLFFADRRVGIVSSFPSQETWGSGNVSTKDRIWIRV